jgi:hypothetical protein
MFRPINNGLVRSISLSVLLLSASALGQFEVAPDHFDSTSKKETVRHTAGKGVKRGPAAGAQGAGRVTGRTSQAAARNKQTSNGTTRTLASPGPIHPRTTAALRPR